MSYLLYFVFITIFVSLDQFSKLAIVRYIKPGNRIVVIRDFFNISHVHNYGAGFSILQNARFFLITLTIVACFALIYLLVTSDKKDVFSRISYLLILSGAIGNFIDRIRLGYVIDFLDFKIFGYDFPVFNVADCFITVGCFLLIIKILWESYHAKDGSDRR